jgi:hypothetical protein
VKNKISVYLDQNILDQIKKGDWNDLQGTIREHNLIPVYSEETLKEINRSKSSEKFIGILADMKAQMIIPDKNGFEFTGTATFHNICPHKQYKHFLDNQKTLPEMGYGLTGLLRKFHGGMDDLSFKEALSIGSNEFTGLLEELFKDIEQSDEFTFLDKDDLKQEFHKMADCLKQSYDYISQELDQYKNSIIKNFQSNSGLRTIELNNIQKPGIVEQVLEKFESSITHKEHYNRDEFIGIVSSIHENGTRKKTEIEKINSVYFMLNTLGYYQDNDLSEENKFIAAFSDMTHAGLASFCTMVFSSDKKFVMKTKAVYEFLNIPTIVLGISNKKPI